MSIYDCSCFFVGHIIGVHDIDFECYASLEDHVQYLRLAAQFLHVFSLWIEFSFRWSKSSGGLCRNQEFSRFLWSGVKAINVL